MGIKGIKAFNPLADGVRYRHKNSARLRTDPIAESPISSSTKKCLALQKNISTAALDDSGLFLNFDTSNPQPQPSSPIPPSSSFPITHSRSTYQSVAWGAWSPFPL
jgi:hypothetical protein